MHNKLRTLKQSHINFNGKYKKNLSSIQQLKTLTRLKLREQMWKSTKKMRKKTTRSQSVTILEKLIFKRRKKNMNCITETKTKTLN